MGPDCAVCVFADYKWLGASPDGLVGSIGLLEIKCPVYQIHQQVPDDYMCQIQGQLEMCDRQWCDFVSFHGGKLAVIRVARSREYWDWMLQRLQHFWACVQMDIGPSENPNPDEGVPPPAVDTDWIHGREPPPPS
jgi:hypothetical protein